MPHPPPSCSSPALYIPFLQISLLRGSPVALTDRLQTRAVGEQEMRLRNLQRSDLFFFPISYRVGLIVSLKSVICLSQNRVNDRLHTAASRTGWGMHAHTHMGTQCTTARVVGPQMLPGTRGSSREELPSAAEWGRYEQGKQGVSATPGFLPHFSACH